MLFLKSEIRKELGKKTKKLRQEGIMPAVLYGQGIKGLAIKVSQKDFEKVFEKTGTSSLLSLELKGKKYKVLIYDTFRDPLSEGFLHADFFQPSAKRKITAEVPLVFEGESPAVKNLGGNLLKEIQSIEVKGLADNLPKEIKIDISHLKSFEDRIQVKDLKFPEGVSPLKEREEIVALVVAPRKEEKLPVEEAEKSEEENIPGQTKEGIREEAKEETREAERTGGQGKKEETKKQQK